MIGITILRLVRGPNIALQSMENLRQPRIVQATSLPDIRHINPSSELHEKNKPSKDNFSDVKKHDESIRILFSLIIQALRR